MVMLQDLYPDPIHEEAQYYLQAALSDMYFARSMLRTVGEDERRRFNQVGFAYGDSSMMGYSPYEVYEEQLANVLYTLFGEGYAGDIACVMLYEEAEQQTLQHIAALDGGPLEIEGVNPVDAGDFEEVLIVELRAYASGPPGGEADNPTARERLDALATALRAAAGERGNPRLYRWRKESEQAEYLRENGSSDDTILLVYGSEPFYPHDIFHGEVFNRLIKAYKHWPGHMIQRKDRTGSWGSPWGGSRDGYR